jgi:Meiotically Up-regulated Gene 113 (MUG113) protein
VTPIYIYPDGGEMRTLREQRRREVTDGWRRYAIAAAEREGISTRAWLLRDIDRRIDRELAGIHDDRQVNGYVYVAGSPDGGGPIKVGVSRTPRDRIQSVRSEVGWPSVALFYIQGEVYKTFVEYEAHRLLWAYRVNGEMFDVSPENAVAAVKVAGETAARSPSLLRNKPMYLDEMPNA